MAQIKHVWINYFSKIKLIDRYLVREVLFPFLLGTIGFVIIGMVDVLFTLIDLFINSGVPFHIIFRLLLFKIPAVMVLFFPMSILFGVMLTLFRMAKDSEITVLRAGGISLWRLMIPILITGLMVVSFSFFINETVVPWSNHVSDNLIRKAVLKKPPPEISANVFFQESKRRYFYIREIDQKRSQMEGIYVYELTAHFPRVITAQKAIFKDRTWTLLNGVVHQFDAKGFLRYEAGFEQMTITAQADVAQFYSEQRTPREMSSQALKSKITELKKSGVNTHALSVDFYLKYSMPFTSLVFSLVGISFSLLFVKTIKDIWGVIIAVLLALGAVGFYFFLTAMFRSLGRGGIVSAFWGAWTPNLLYLLLALGLLVFITYRD